MLRRLLAHLLRRLHRGARAAAAPGRPPAGASSRRAAPPPPPAARAALPPPPPPPPPAVERVRLLFEDGTYVVVASDPVLERRIAGVLEAIGAPTPAQRASL